MIARYSGVRIALMAKSDGYSNLKPLNTRTKEEQRKIQTMGGKASGKARRKKASLMRCAQRVLESDIPKELKPQLKKIIGEVEDENDTLFTLAVASMTKEAISGNTHAFAQLKDLVQDMDAAYIEDEQEEDELSRSLRELAEEMNNG